MAELGHVAPWVHHGGSGAVTPSRLHAQIRALTSSPPNKSITKSVSSPHLGVVARPPYERADSEDMNTIPDPRSPTPQPTISRNNSTDSSIHPDLSQEVATLSTKLINAINHQTTLDDTLQQVRHERDQARELVAQLEPRTHELEHKVSSGLLVDKVIYEKMEKQLLTELDDERRRRAEAEKAKRRMDGEVEQLTAALFEEANVMVAGARKDTEASEKRNEQLRQQLKDAETLQLSLQEQLQDLKTVMERMTAQADDESNTLPTTTAPSTPGITAADKMTKLFEAANLTPNHPTSEDILPDHPLHFSHLIHPVLRSDLASFRDFEDMSRLSARSAPASRVSSGNYGSLNVLGLGSLTNNSTGSLPSIKSSTASGPISPREQLHSPTIPNLKDDRFFKRAISEDIEPTLRLDIAPGLSWMARRTVLNSIIAASLVVEPNPAPSRYRSPSFPCSLCGESRKDDEHGRKYWFKVSESEETRHPLCDWCLGRVRSTCNYVSFLRMIAAGHWRAETDEEKRSAWEESVRLRERMFWNRIGGGVVPAFMPMKDSPHSPALIAAAPGASLARHSVESRRSNKPSDSAVDVTEQVKATRNSQDDPFRSKDQDMAKRVSIGSAVLSAAPVSSTLSREEEQQIEHDAEAQLQEEVQRSMEAIMAQSKPGRLQLRHQRSFSTPPNDVSAKKKDPRLSLTIPGAFE